MTQYENIGQIWETEGEELFDWIIPASWLRKREEDICVTSPHFDLPDSSWHLTLYPNGYKRYRSKGWIGLFLHRADIGSPKSITYTLVIDVRGDRKEFTKSRIFDRRKGSSGEPRLLTKKDQYFNKDFDSVIIACRINSYSFTSLQEIPDSVSCAIQTEIPDSATCAIQTEIPDSVSCGIQTEIPDSGFLIQTEIPVVPDSVTDKENSKEENGSLLDTKEDTILRDRLKQLLIKASDYDVTINVQDKEFRAHRLILSARSPVFAMMFTHNSKENITGTINIEDCDPESFDEFLLYVYSGRTKNLTPSKALRLYYTADKYDFPVLKERCVIVLKMSLSITSICDVVLLAAEHQEKELLEVASGFFARNMEEILVSVTWQKFMIENPVEANELYIKAVEIVKMVLSKKKCVMWKHSRYFDFI